MIEAHEGHGEGAYVMGVYATPEAAQAALEKAPNMQVYEKDGQIRGKPVDKRLRPHEWAFVGKYPVKR